MMSHGLTFMVLAYFFILNFDKPSVALGEAQFKIVDE